MDFTLREVGAILTGLESGGERMCLTFCRAGGGCHVEHRISLVIIALTMTTFPFSG